MALSDAGPAVGSLSDLAAGILARPARLGPVRLVAVDGPSGAGKTSVAARLAGAVLATGTRVGVVNTDDLLDGWTDLVTFWPRLERQVLGPIRAGAPAGYHRYDWLVGAFGAFLPVPELDVLILEGVTSARRAIRPELSLSVFVTAPPDVCLARVLARDGEAVREPLERWRREEAAFFAQDGTEAAADLVIDGGVPEDEPGERYRWLRRRGTIGE